MHRLPQLHRPVPVFRALLQLVRAAAHTRRRLAQPYSVEHNYPHRKGVVEKCILCPEMLRMGMLPGCAEHCTMGAIYFGDELEDAVTN